MESERKNHLTPMQFVNRRLKRIIIPLVILALIWIPLYYHFDLAYPPNTETSISQVILQILNVGGWFVSAILIMYLVFMLFCYILDRFGRKSAIVVLAGGTILGYIICDRLLGYYTALSIPIFSVGILASLYKDKQHNRWLNHSMIYLVTAMIVSTSYCVIIHSSGALAIHSIINYVAIAFLILIFTNFSPSIVFPAILGEISFDLYLIHKKIITAYYAVNNQLIDLYLWIGFTLVLTVIFVVLRKYIVKKVNQVLYLND